jgi:hypothetical protein
MENEEEETNSLDSVDHISSGIADGFSIECTTTHAGCHDDAREKTWPRQTKPPAETQSPKLSHDSVLGRC